MDKLSKDMKACEKAGFGVSYGKWKATQPAVTKKPKAKSGRVCKYCGRKCLSTTEALRESSAMIGAKCFMASGLRLSRYRRNASGVGSPLRR